MIDRLLPLNSYFSRNNDDKTALALGGVSAHILDFSVREETRKVSLLIKLKFD